MTPSNVARVKDFFRRMGLKVVLPCECHLHINEYNKTEMVWNVRYEWPSSVLFTFNC